MVLETPQQVSNTTRASDDENTERLIENVNTSDGALQEQCSDDRSNYVIKSLSLKKRTGASPAPQYQASLPLIGLVYALPVLGYIKEKIKI